MSKKDFRINFRFHGKRYYIETFNPLWWLIRIVEVVGAAFLIYVWIVLMILAAPVGA